MRVRSSLNGGSLSWLLSRGFENVDAWVVYRGLN